MIDTHAHLNFKQFDEDREQVLRNADANDITKFVNIGADFQTSKESIKLADQYPQIYATVGIHPCSAEEWNQEAAEHFNNQLSSNPKVIGVGEIGIDYYRCTPEEQHPNIPNKTHREVEQTAFTEQIQLAKKHKKPFVIHCRNARGTTWREQGSASAEIWQILNEEKYFNCVFHCFAEDLEFAQKLWEQGIYISFNGTITYPNSIELRKVAAVCPPELYLLETDCPFLPPQSKRGERNEPAYIKKFAETLTEIRNCSYEQIAKETTENSKRFFNLA